MSDVGVDEKWLGEVGCAKAVSTLSGNDVTAVSFPKRKSQR